MYGELMLDMLWMNSVDVVVVKVIWKVNIRVDKHISPSLVRHNRHAQSGPQDSRGRSGDTGPHGHL